MNRKQARQLAKQRYGPGASVVNVSNLDRHQRFGIMIYIPGGAFNRPELGCLGHGDSYQAAWDHTLESGAANAVANEWTKTKRDYETFKNDPVGYKQMKIDEMQKLLDKGKQNG